MEVAGAQTGRTADRNLEANPQNAATSINSAMVARGVS